MPNWVYNNLIIQSDNAEALASLKERVGTTVQVPGFDYQTDENGKFVLDDNGKLLTVLLHHTTEEPVFSFWNIVQPNAEEMKAYGDQGTCDWNIENWGTKWDVAGNVEVIEDTESYWHLEFQTAWSPPHEVLIALSEQHPEVSIRNEWREEQGFGAHQVYSEGTHWLDKEWNVPESHEDYVENVGEDDCPCISYGLEESQYPYEDCPREALTTKQAVAELEKVSELI